MAQTVRLTQFIDGELPFTLNLPCGEYTVAHDGRQRTLKLLQGQIMVPAGTGQQFVGTPDEIAAHMGDAWAGAHKQELRTLVRQVDVVELPVSQLDSPSEAEVLGNLKYHILKDTHQFDGKPDELTACAVATLAEYDEDTRQRLAADTALRTAAGRMYGREDPNVFCAVLNRLIRAYATAFDDFFVHEVLPQHFANTSFNGLRTAVFCNGYTLSNFRDAGGYFPFILRRAWQLHSEDRIAAFRQSLADGTPADPVAFLGTRAKGLFIRGDYRSAIIEAWAALDLCLTRKLRDGYRKGGKMDPEIDVLLKGEIRFKQRANKMLKDAIGRAAVDLDPPLWNRVIGQHHDIRHGIAHADREPTRQEAESAVNDVLALVASIGTAP